MAAVCQAVFLLGLCVLVRHTAADSACNVSCTTDLISMVNCSVLASEGLVSCDVQVNCSDEVEHVNGSCLIKPPHQWCTMQIDDFYYHAEVDTVCTIKVNQSNKQDGANEWHEKRVLLYTMIKPQDPFNLTLTTNSQGFNLSWNMIYTEDSYGDLYGELVYSVRLRPKDELDEKKFQVYMVREDHRYQEILFSLLSPGRTYVMDVRASLRPGEENKNKYNWSEWSPSVEGLCPCSEDACGDSLLMGMMAPLAVVSIVLIVVFCKWGLSKKVRLLQYIPNPQDFFKPLYNTYEGDFKKWVGPVLTFSSFDVLEKSLPLQVLSEKQLSSVPLQRELPQETGSGVGDWSLLSLVNPASSKRYFLGGSSLSTAQSGGLISMDTVTVSGQEGSMLDWTGGSIRTRPRSEDHGIGQRAEEGGDEGEAEFLGRVGVNDWQIHANDMDNIEGISLSSYNSTEQSDYGYPQMGLDLDTIDSGFLESDCSSPVNSECDGGDQMEAALLNTGVGTHSNYVKQWVAIIPVSENSDNSEQ